jgi:hypothetical protein
MMEIKIVSDGTPYGTKLINIETGDEIKDIKSIDWHIEVDKLATAKIEFLRVPVELQVQRENTLSWEKKSMSWST